MNRLFLLIILFMVLLAAAFTDIKWRIIPNALILSASAVRLCLYLPAIIQDEIRIGEIFLHTVISVLFPIVACFTARVFVPDGIGMGDVKLMMLISLYLGFWDGIVAFLLSFLLAALTVSGFLFMDRGKRKRAIPLAPAFLLGTALAVLIRLL